MSSLPQPDLPKPENPGKHEARNPVGSDVKDGRRTRRSLLLGGSLLIMLTLIFWRPLQQRCLAYFLLRSDAPSEEVLAGAVAEAADPASLLMEFWRTQRCPHREFVVRYIERNSTTRPELFRAMQGLVVEAAGDPDIAVRESAMATLGRMEHRQFRSLALQQLADADPAARLIGLQSLRRIASSNDVPIAVRFLEDPEPRVVVAAALVLQKATARYFGIKSTDALPQFTCIDTNPPPAPDLAAIRRSVQRVRVWWSAHEGEFPTAPVLPVPPADGHGRVRLATGDFTLKDWDGKGFRLSQLRGKTVLLSFWSAGAPASLDDVPALKDLYERYGDHLAVVGVCIPPAPSCADEHDHGHNHAQHQHDEAGGLMTGRAGTEHMRCSVQDAVTRLSIYYPMILDMKGAVGQRFSVENLPTYVLIDGEGMVRRRFVGFRSESAMTAMIETVAGSSGVGARQQLR
jgi:hypothetical protein